MYYPCANGQEVFAQDKREVGCTRHAVCHMASLKDVGINSPRPTEQQHCAVLVESKFRGGWRTMLHGFRGRRKGRREKGRRPRLLMSPSYAFFFVNLDFSGQRGPSKFLQTSRIVLLQTERSAIENHSACKKAHDSAHIYFSCLLEKRYDFVNGR